MKKSSSQKKGGTSLKLRITKRLANTRRHTLGYVIDNDRVNVKEATRLARNGQLYGVRVVGNHIQSNGRRGRLENLPVEITSKV